MIAEPSETARVEVADLPPLSQDVDLDVYVDARVVEADDACSVAVGLDAETAVTMALDATSETSLIGAWLVTRSAGGATDRSTESISLVRDRWYRLAMRLRGGRATLTATTRTNVPIPSPAVTLDVPAPRADRVAVLGEPGLRPGVCRVLLDNVLVVRPP
jgi:hypothetical protein